jgi:hypothetical protein
MFNGFVVLFMISAFCCKIDEMDYYAVSSDNFLLTFLNNLQVRWSSFTPSYKHTTILRSCISFVFEWNMQQTITSTPLTLVWWTQHKHLKVHTRKDQQYALICTTPLLLCFSSSLQSSGSLLDPPELLVIQIKSVVYHIMCGYATCVPDCHTLYVTPPIRFVLQVTQEDLRGSLMIVSYCWNK